MFERVRRVLWPFLLTWLITLASGRSALAVPVTQFASRDKLMHLLFFGLLATLLVRIPRKPGRRRLPIALCAILLVSLFGAADEYHQSMTPGRSVEFDDWIADTLGAVLASVLYLYWPRYRKVLETDLIPRRWSAGKKPAAMPEADR